MKIATATDRRRVTDSILIIGGMLVLAVFVGIILVRQVDLSGGYFGQVDAAEASYREFGQKSEARTMWLDAGDKLAFDLQHANLTQDRRDGIVTRLEKIRAEFGLTTDLNDEEKSDLFRIDQALRIRQVQQQQIADSEQNR